VGAEHTREGGGRREEVEQAETATTYTKAKPSQAKPSHTQVSNTKKTTERSLARVARMIVRGGCIGGRAGAAGAQGERAARGGREGRRVGTHHCSEDGAASRARWRRNEATKGRSRPRIERRFLRAATATLTVALLIIRTRLRPTATRHSEALLYGARSWLVVVASKQKRANAPAKIKSRKIFGAHAGAPS